MNNNPRNYPVKVFKIGQLQNCVLDNINENTELVLKRLKELQSHPCGSLEFYKALEGVFTEFVDVYEHDKATAQMPEPYGLFNTPEEKQLWIDNHLLALDFDYYLGFILYNYHEWLFDCGQLPVIILSRMVMDYPNIYNKALYDYICVLKRIPEPYSSDIDCKNYNAVTKEFIAKLTASLQRGQLYSNNKAFFASFALPMLIERSLIDFMQRSLVKELMMNLFNKHKDGAINLSESDLTFVNSFLQGKRYMEGKREDVMKRCYDLFKSANVVTDKDSEQIILGTRGNSPITLGQFLKNAYVIKHIKKPYYDVLDMLFSIKKINLRNSIMHGSNIVTDPYALCFSAVEFQLFWAIIDRMIFC